MTVVTPVDVNAYHQILLDVGYDLTETEFLVNSFHKGFPFCYEGEQQVKMTSPNLKLNIGSHVELWNKVMKEVKLKRYAEPYKVVPFEYYIQSPIGLVPKDNGKDTRLIFHLSYPRGKGTSVNANIPKTKCMVTYPDFSDAIRICIEIGVSCKLGKSDMRSAFRNLGMRLMDFPWLIMKARSPLDNQWYYFIDKCLRFGSSISCAHFQRFSNSIAFVMKIRTGCKPVNYLDVYLFAALRRLWCNQLIQSFLELCEKVRFPVSLEKTEWAQGIVIFLGLLIDAARQVVCIPMDKIVKARELIAEVLQKKKVTIKTLQKVCGYLNFLCRCVVPGRAFTRRLYYFTSNKQTSSNGKVLQGYHHIRVNKEMREDLVMWQTFIAHPSIFCRPFLDFSRVLEAESIRFYMDASRNYSLGMGGICEQSW